jgi:hypothetical protein
MSDTLLSTVLRSGLVRHRRRRRCNAGDEIELILNICNGYLGIRASIAETGRFSHPSPLAAGIYVADGDSDRGLLCFRYVCASKSRARISNCRLGWSRARASTTTRPEPGFCGGIGASRSGGTHHEIDLPSPCVSRGSARHPLIGSSHG